MGKKDEKSFLELHSQKVRKVDDDVIQHFHHTFLLAKASEVNT